MLTKTILATGAAAGILMLATPLAFAQTTQTTTTGTTAATTATANVAVKIACVGTAVNAREAALGTAITAHASAESAAYAARATALSAAYKEATLKEANTKTKTAWSAFNASMKSAQKAW